MIQLLKAPSFRIESVAAAVPAAATDSFSLLSPLVGEEKAASIVKTTGFSVRRAAPPGVTVRDFMTAAARAALNGVEAASVGAVVACSFSNPMRFPALAVDVAAALGLGTDVAALDLSMACSGYPYTLFCAAQFAASSGRRVLVLDGDVQTPFLDPSDPNTLAVLSDAATATLIAPDGSMPPPVFAFLSHGDGGKALACDGRRLTMDGFSVFGFVAGEAAAFLGEFAAAAGPFDAFVPHQANCYMVRQLARSLGLIDRIHAAGPEYGNPGSASVPLALATGDFGGRTMLAAYGAGLSASAAAVDLDAARRRSVVEI